MFKFSQRDVDSGVMIHSIYQELERCYLLENIRFVCSFASKFILGLQCYYKERNALLCNSVLVKFITLPEFHRFYLVVLSTRNICVFRYVEDKKEMKLLLVRMSFYLEYQNYHILAIGKKS